METGNIYQYNANPCTIFIAIDDNTLLFNTGNIMDTKADMTNCCENLYAAKGLVDGLKVFMEKYMLLDEETINKVAEIDKCLLKITRHIEGD